jgi:hypothetical protein
LTFFHLHFTFTSLHFTLLSPSLHSSSLSFHLHFTFLHLLFIFLSFPSLFFHSIFTFLFTFLSIHLNFPFFSFFSFTLLSLHHYSLRSPFTPSLLSSPFSSTPSLLFFILLSLHLYFSLLSFTFPSTSPLPFRHFSSLFLHSPFIFPHFTSLSVFHSLLHLHSLLPFSFFPLVPFIFSTHFSTLFITLYHSSFTHSSPNPPFTHFSIPPFIHHPLLSLFTSPLHPPSLSILHLSHFILSTFLSFTFHSPLSHSLLSIPISLFTLHYQPTFSIYSPFTLTLLILYFHPLLFIIHPSFHPLYNFFHHSPSIFFTFHSSTSNHHHFYPSLYLHISLFTHSPSLFILTFPSPLTLLPSLVTPLHYHRLHSSFTPH